MLAEGEMHIWQGVAPRETTYADWAMLSKEEHSRWLRMRPIPAARYAASHAAARKILGRYLHAAPVLLRMSRATCPSCGRPSGGRPVVHTSGAPLWFSLSHSGPHWILAVSRHLVGADIEVMRPVDLDALESLALSGPERQVLWQHDRAEQHDLFFRSWTRKEATFKASGNRCFSDLDVQPQRSDGATVECPGRTGLQRWHVRSLDVGNNCYAAVAAPDDTVGNVVLRHWPSTAAPA